MYDLELSPEWGVFILEGIKAMGTIRDDFFDTVAIEYLDVPTCEGICSFIR